MKFTEMDKDRYSIYKFISLVFSHPFTASFFILAVYLLIKSSILDVLASIFGISIISVLPSTLWALKNGKSLFIENQKERTPFLFISSLILFAECFFGKIFSLPLLFTISFLYAANTFALFLINFRVKASVHVAGIAGPTTFLVFCFNPLFSLLYLFALPAAISRLKLKAHAKKELIFGFVIPFFVTFFVSLLFKGKII